MKNTVVRKIIREAVSISLLPAMFFVVVLVFSNRDMFVTYDENYSPENKASLCTENTVHVSTDSDNSEYFSFQLLPEDVYSIACEGERVCVYNSDDEKVYTARAFLSDFPENDRLVLENRITSLTLNELIEIMEYIES